eukprot:NODE_1938_length_705_cov_193.137195_g1509_i0.p5 GENE.NODE_1938_length_705_cov_193.137195_g1509_i0~~NODE_1938_length_705_cov_193.137195_g1509_i0.p5  ORF type:complete len:51 (-),score=13.95 NODE_1938_length_705_cov_193.137195_g1509_i0:290-442(-)
MFSDAEGDEAVVEKIDLTKLGNGKPSAEDMRTLLAEKGFEKRAPPASGEL